ncbi:hypothetical protein D9C10_16015 [Bacillus subtilis subsp. subtilis]|nr:hypothetical protein D9C10_16015 [Bacillus subtilis subsp. subtilis]
MGALFLHLKPDEYLKKLYKTKKLVEKTSFSLQAERLESSLFFYLNRKLTHLLIKLLRKLLKLFSILKHLIHRMGGLLGY